MIRSVQECEAQYRSMLQNVRQDTVCKDFLYVQGHMLQLSIMNALLIVPQAGRVREVHTAQEWAALENPVKAWIEVENPNADLPGAITLLQPEETVRETQLMDYEPQLITVFPSSSCRYPDPLRRHYNMPVLCSALFDEISGNSQLIDRETQYTAFETENGRQLLAKFHEEEHRIRFRKVSKNDANSLYQDLMHEYFLYLAYCRTALSRADFKRRDHTYTAWLQTVLACYALHIQIDPTEIHVTANMKDDEKSVLQYLIRAKRDVVELVDKVLWRYYKNTVNGAPMLGFDIKEGD